MTRRRSETMTEDERAAFERIGMTLGELTAVGEVELCQRLWPMRAAAAMSKPGGERSTEMTTLRRRARDVINSLRLGYRSAILDTKRGYFYTTDPAERLRFCTSRHKRAMTSLVIESIVKHAAPLEDGVQLFLEFLKSHEEISRRIAKREGREHKPLDPQTVVAAVAEGAKQLTETDSSAD